ncbi:MAG: ATP-binding protein, partial [Cyclobacteriaceae bacterium]|nr:ATP-binding protein [Cyclobacteriaceae bacterium]
MDNPFIYNKAVTGDYFVGHDSLVQSLHHQFKQHRHTLIEGPFGWGKTSLVSESINRLAYGGDTYPHCWIDCLPFRSEQAFYQGLIRNIAKTLAKDEPWHQLATRALQQRSIAFSFRSLEHTFVL